MTPPFKDTHLGDLRPTLRPANQILQSTVFPGRLWLSSIWSSCQRSLTRSLPERSVSLSYLNLPLKLRCVIPVQLPHNQD